jgi:hypothetical protein
MRGRRKCAGAFIGVVADFFVCISKEKGYSFYLEDLPHVVCHAAWYNCVQFRLVPDRLPSSLNGPASLCLTSRSSYLGGLPTALDGARS